MSDPSAGPPLEGQVDLVERFWQLCQEDSPPDGHQFLEQSGGVSLAQRVAVLRIDQVRRWQQGEQVLRVLPVR